MGASGGASLPHPTIKGGTGTGIAIIVVLLIAIGLAVVGGWMVRKQICARRELEGGGGRAWYGRKKEQPQKDVELV